MVRLPAGGDRAMFHPVRRDAMRFCVIPEVSGLFVVNTVWLVRPRVLLSVPMMKSKEVFFDARLQGSERNHREIFTG